MPLLTFKLLHSFCLVWFFSKTHCAASLSHVTELNESNFTDFINSRKYTFVKFYAPWCQYCKEVEPVFEEAAKQALDWGRTDATQKVSFAQVDITNNPILARDLSVRQYPTMSLFRDGKRQVYSGPRSNSRSLLHWLSRMIRPALVHVRTTAEAWRLTGPDVATYLLEVASVEDPVFKMWEELASKNWPMGFFMVRINKKGERPSVSALRDNEDAQITYDLEEGKLMRFMIDESVPHFGELTFFNDAQFGMRTPNYFMFCGDLDDYDAVRPEMVRVAKKHRSDYNFVWVNITHPSWEAKAQRSFGFRKFPSTVLVSNNDRYIYKGEYVEAAIDNFLNDFESNRLQKYLVSEQPRAAASEEHQDVKTVVGSNFAELVLRKDGREAMILFYAPYCGPCMEMMPIYEKVAKALRTSHDQILIGKFDYSHNEIDFPGFLGRSLPALFHVKRNEHSEDAPHDISLFEGDPTNPKAILNFLNGVSSKRFDVLRDEL